MVFSIDEQSQIVIILEVEAVLGIFCAHCQHLYSEQRKAL